MGSPSRWPLLCLFLALCLPVPGGTVGDDGATLTALKGVFQGSTGNALSTWTSASFFCTWQGVFCADTTVYKLDLSNQGLSGSIVDVMDTVSNLPGLQYLYLNNNQLSGGPIPDSLGQMTSLLGIHLQNNQIVGGLPDVFSRLTSITEIFLSNNPLGGTLPASLQALTGLQSLDMSSTALTGSIPSWMGSFQQLRLLYLGTNNLTGSIPPLTGLSSIMEFYVNINQLSGSIPPSIGGLKTLVKLYLDRNSFSGPIPATLGGLSSLRSLYLDNTQVNGTIPSELVKLLPTLTALDLRFTKLVGTVPAGLLSNAIVCDGFAPWGWPAGSGPTCIFSGNPSLVCPTGSVCPVTSSTPAPTPIPAKNTTIPVNTTAPTPGLNGSIVAPAPVPGQNTTIIAPTPQNVTVIAPSPVPGQNVTIIAPTPVAGQNGSTPALNASAPSPAVANQTLPGQNTTIVVPGPPGSNSTVVIPAPPGLNTTVIVSAPPGQNSTVVVPSLNQTVIPINQTTGTPGSSACTCPVNQTAGLGSVTGRCNCVYGLGASYRFVDRNLVDWTPSFQTAFLNALASQLGVQPFQIILGRAVQGSILVDTSVVPLVGDKFQIWTAAGIEDVLEGRNGRSLQLNQSDFGNVLVTSVTPPAQLDPSTAGSTVPNSAAPSSSSGSATGAIIGGIVGAIAGVLLIAGIIWAAIVYSKRRRKSHSQSHSMLVAPAGGPTSADPSFERLPSKSISVSVTSFPMLSNYNGAMSSSPPPPPSPGGAAAILSSPWRSSPSPPAADSSPRSSTPPLRTSPRKSTSSDHGARERLERSTTDSGYRGGRDTVSRTTRLLSLRESTEVLPPWREFTSEEIRVATGNYNPENVLGSGLFGTVYKAQFADGRIAAVKRAEIAPSVLASRQAEFQRELETLSQLRHRHLVPFLGFCEVASRELMLVYDFMPNGTLQDNLPGGARGILDWPARVKVAVEVASAIEYLHNGCRPPIVHRDIKANNILLDETDSAYLGDFGLATLYDAERTHITTAIKGTPGYLDPQYFATQELTQRSDVYSFGVLLLSVVTGKKAIFSVLELSPSDPDRARLQRQAIGKVNLTTWAVPLIREGRVDAIADETIPDVERYMHDIEIVAEIAAECVQDMSQDRPDMAEVLVRLRGVLALVQQ